MTRRTDRLGNLIREIVGQMIHTKISDPRIDPALTSITRVEVAEDLLTARIFVSVLGDDEAAQRNAVRALQHAAGRIQETIGQQVRLRNTPLLSFHEDAKFKNTLKTLELIQQAMDEIEQKESHVAGESADGSDE